LSRRLYTIWLFVMAYEYGNAVFALGLETRCKMIQWLLLGMAKGLPMKIVSARSFVRIAQSSMPVAVFVGQCGVLNVYIVSSQRKR
jgi:hypothetical protein